ncbi:MAG TPA: polysaccharide deacetylase family protein [Chthoniobacterales bacterium]|jgi:peptidoglycan/xylan/chitin deacetylase (PgdA/CDA1 family)
MRRKVILGFAIFAAFFFLGVVWFHPWLALAVLFCSHVLILFPTLVANCQWWGPVVRRFETKEREVWLTLDDGPDATQTPRMLELLERFEAKATFFVVGKRAVQFPELIEKIVAAGHEIGNHTCLHPSGSFWMLGPRRLAAEIDCFPVSSPFFRAPAGLKNGFLHPLLEQRGMRLIGWTVRGLDTLSHDASAVGERIQRRVKPGAILLLHEGHRAATEPEFHPRCLERTLALLKQEKYRCVLPRPEQLRPHAGEK